MDERSNAVELFDDDLGSYSLEAWRARNLAIYALLARQGLIDPKIVPEGAHRYLTDQLIHIRVGAANDPQNAGHVRAQNENVIHYALAAAASPATLTIALEAGFIHDLNKAFGEPLRADAYAVRDAHGRPLRVMSTMAQIVGLNHLGARTRGALDAATRLAQDPLSAEVAAAIDRCIIHHGLGSSRFIKDLVQGQNPWWGDEFVDTQTGAPRIIHPPQPPLTIESLIHDLADSTQQMQGGAAWLMKYPAGFWRASGRSFADMLSRPGTPEDTVPMSLRHQIEVETDTCRQLIDQALDNALISPSAAERLRQAVDAAAESSRAWLDDRPQTLAGPAQTAYHDLAQAWGVSAEQAHLRLQNATPGTPEGDHAEELLWRSGRRLDRERAKDLARAVESAGI